MKTHHIKNNNNMILNGSLSKPTTDRYIQAYMQSAYVFAKLSYCIRRKVGAVIVKDNKIISIGYNGTPSGWDNCCEHNNVTLPHVIHAEKNAILKLAKSSESGNNAIIFTTKEPCLDCATLIHLSGIIEVYWSEESSRDNGVGLEFLRKCNIKTKKVEM